MVVDRAKFGCQAEHLEIFAALDLLPPLDQVPYRSEREDEGLSSADRHRVRDNVRTARLGPDLRNSQVAKGAKEVSSSINLPKRRPALQVVSEMPVEPQVIFQDEDPI